MIQWLLLCILVVAVAGAHAQLRPTGAYPLRHLHEQCITFSQVRIGPSEDEHDAARCGVSQFGAFATVADRVYYRALYCLTPHWSANDSDGGCKYHGARGLAIFVAARGSQTAMLLLERADPSIGLLVYDDPKIVENDHGMMLQVSIRVDGTGVGNESEYYLLRQGAWYLLDAHGWLKHFQVPTQLEIRKGVWPDLRTMSAKIDLYRQDDPNCCPSGGAALVKLALQGDAFIVKSVRYTPGADDASPAPR